VVVKNKIAFGAGRLASSSAVIGGRRRKKNASFQRNHRIQPAGKQIRTNFGEVHATKKLLI